MSVSWATTVCAYFPFEKSYSPKFQKASRGSQRSKPSGTTLTENAGASRTFSPSRFANGTEQRIVKICKAVYRALRIRGYGRIDLRVTPEGEIVILEANPNPNLDRDDEFAQSAVKAGLKLSENDPTHPEARFRRRPLSGLKRCAACLKKPEFGRRPSSAFALLAFSFSCCAIDSRKPRERTAALIILEGHALAQVKQRLQAGDAALAPSLNKLKRDADRALLGGPLSVTEKSITPPSGDKHDYMSIAPYWWPNPNTANGLPYVRRDGEVNPERDQTSDRKRLENMIQTVKTLALGYFFTDREAYAAQAAKTLRAWFLDAPTKMNPHLRFAQSIPGRNQGRGDGIIETHNLPELLDSVALLVGSKSWAETDHEQLRNWFNSYLTWLSESPEGKAEAKADNNHGSWYDVQIAGFALFVGRGELAKKVMGEFGARRIAKQIEPDGRQPRELGRTQGWNYAVFNLEALFDAAAIAEKLGIDLWNFRTDDNRSMRKSLDWLMPFATGAKPWPYKQISPFQPEKLAPLLRRAALQYREPAYEQAIGKISKINGDERWRLIYGSSP